MSRRSQLHRGLLSGLLLVITSIVVGQRLPSAPASDDSSSAENPPTVFQELLEVRKAVGGSVLQGTLLEPASVEAAEADFRAGLEKAAKSRDATLPLAGTESEPVTAVAPLQAAPHKVTTRTIATLRQHSGQLDAIANDLEYQRAYEPADRIRESATALRLLARQLDVDERG